ncbi:uncharacterized protein ATNIH1004_003903 [Aspergillus tanneri]|uniref:Uncharacterized protein n=1 Tax=Aspergillus tanneri TaxID=1220188 RepID=A0A5M9MRT7_9EURO|nr:uncharacterized protein ATNIH1004_003903 [Aspergillus tanneri]KAA8648020.1 hypothetical protein ATNIH1004_003903 [Aspergillus tanneri]
MSHERNTTIGTESSPSFLTRKQRIRPSPSITNVLLTTTLSLNPPNPNHAQHHQSRPEPRVCRVLSIRQPHPGIRMDIHETLLQTHSGLRVQR